MAFSTAEFDREGEKVDLVDHEILNWSVNSLEEFRDKVKVRACESTPKLEMR